MNWLLELLSFILPQALIDAIGIKRRGKIDRSQEGEARFDSKTGKRIK